MTTAAAREEEFSRQREKMVQQQLRPRGIADPRVLAAMGRVPRHRFVPPAMAAEAYADHPLPIGKGQTISQPYMVAAMTEQLRLTGSQKVLEIGTGSGYQTAVLAELAAEVISLEIHAELARQAEEKLAALGYDNVTIVVADGTRGYPPAAPYQGIIVTAGAPHVPRALTEQLADGGRLVIPVGRHGYQMLKVITREGTRLREEDLFLCSFVPLVGEDGWRSP
ncbi:MAG: protein-L-isoaspartate(D-aspartate) O-methyltransferase [Deltaproteobacteria bacterium]|nr:protein-L-isoaspartate(D-aspartate) O-methyltransferase [Deltaproteobacteria bacterium]